ncbi:MAG: glycosyltransferase family 39 protein [Deltaproteobacteria bacterium]|nr:glycosyltransferase family 39 protein [Deltaproteobacteria bacterium]
MNKNLLGSRYVRPIAWYGIVIFLLALFVAQSVHIALKKSNTWDESAHILAGYAYLKDGMDYLSPLHHPAFGRLLTGFLPYAALDLDFDKKVMPEESPDSDFFPYSIKFIYKNKTAGRTILFLSRLSNVMLGVILGLYLFFWSKRLWGYNGAILALFLYALSPDFLAHASLATTDLPIAAFFFISSYYLYCLVVDGASVKRVLFASVALTFAFTTKHTAFLLVPLVALSYVFTARREGWTRAAIAYLSICIIVYIGIWAIYGFRFLSAGDNYVPLYWGKFASSRFEPLFTFLRSIKFAPEAYLYGVNGVLSGSGGGKSAFLMGGYSTTGWWYYFLVAFFIKTPIPALILLSAAILYSLKDKEYRARTAMVLLPVVLIFAVFSIQKVNIGARHVLPAYPFLIMLIGSVANIKTESRRAGRAVFYLCCIWYAWAAISIFPHQLAYFNEFIGGPKNGYKYLVDSNLDWGQDLGGLKSYMDEHGIKKIKLAYFGLNDPADFGIDYDYLPSYVVFNPKNVKETIELKGWFAISATMLQGVYLRDSNLYALFKEIRPVDTIGYSIFIYRFD